MKINFYTKYNHPSPVSPSGQVSMTDAQYANDCDINVILEKFCRTGQLPVARKVGVSGDFSEVGDFAKCLERVNRAKEDFASLPSSVRARFGNDPSAFVDFVLDPKNTDECVKLGIRVERRETPTNSELLSRIEENTRKEVTLQDGK